MMAAVSPRALVWRRLLRHRLAELSLGFLVILFALVLLSPLLAAWRGVPMI